MSNDRRKAGDTNPVAEEWCYRVVEVPEVQAVVESQLRPHTKDRKTPESECNEQEHDNAYSNFHGEVGLGQRQGGRYDARDSAPVQANVSSDEDHHPIGGEPMYLAHPHAIWEREEAKYRFRDNHACDQ